MNSVKSVQSKLNNTSSKINSKFGLGLSPNQKLLLNVVLVLLFLVIVVYIFNSLTMAQDAGVLLDTRVNRRPQRQHNYVLRSHNSSTWFPPWVNRWARPSRRCPGGCVFTGRRGDRDQNGFACPDGPQCNSPGCCKYDRDCMRC